MTVSNTSFSPFKLLSKVNMSLPHAYGRKRDFKSNLNTNTNIRQYGRFHMSNKVVRDMVNNSKCSTFMRDVTVYKTLISLVLSH